MAIDTIKSSAVLDGAIATADIADDAVTGAKIENNPTIAGNATISGSLSAKGGAVFNEDSADLDFRVESNGNANMLFVDGGNDKVGIGTNTPARQFTVQNTIANSGGELGILSSDSSTTGQFGTLHFGNNTDTSLASIRAKADGSTTAGKLEFNTEPNGGAIETRMTLTSAGDLLIGKSTTGLQTAGHRISSAAASFTRDGGGALIAVRLSNDGNIAEFYKDTNVIGTIGSYADRIVIGAGDTCLKFDEGNNSIMPFDTSTASNRDNAVDMGYSSVRFDDIYATNGTIQTSDRNEKQDIEELSDAEKRVAVVAKGLMRKFRWKDKVTEKGDNARTHFGIIAQDLQDAFTAESLDASKYAVFCSNTWWEKEISVDAVEADEENDIEAKDAYTKIDTKEEATAGYTERTRLGVRYSELLAFIISAI